MSDWEKDIRTVYAGILPEEIIENTVIYWRKFIQQERDRAFQETITQMEGVIGENEDLYRVERNKGMSDWRTERETGGNEVREIMRKRLAALHAEGVRGSK